MSAQPDLFAQPRQTVKRRRYPHTPGVKSDDRTARDAADRTEPTVAARHARILAALAGAGPTGLTADECAVKIGVRWDQLRPRFSELRKLGRIVPTGEERASAHGNPMMVWRLA